MISCDAEECIAMAVEGECQTAIEKYGSFHSHHEAWAVLREEVQEVIECIPPFDSKTDRAIDFLWDLVRYDAAGKEAEEQIDQIYEVAEELAKECIQVMAVCRKWMRLIDKECEKNE